MTLQMNQDLVSIITANYNSEKYIEETIQSVIAQSYTNWEMLIVDDNSTDESVRIIQKYTSIDQRIKLFQQQVNAGPTVARNVAIEKAKGEFIAILDSDDIWLPQKLEKQITILKKNKDAVIAFSFYEHMDQDGNLMSKIIKAPLVVNYNMMLKSNFIGNCTAIYNKELAGNPRFEKVEGHEDYVLWLEVLKGGMKAYCVPEILAKYRKHQTSVSANKFKGAKWHWDIHRNVLNTPFFKRCYFFSFYIFYAIKKHY